MDVFGGVLRSQSGWPRLPSGQDQFLDGLPTFARARDAGWRGSWHRRADQARNGYYGWVPVSGPGHSFHAGSCEKLYVIDSSPRHLASSPGSQLYPHEAVAAMLEMYTTWRLRVESYYKLRFPFLISSSRYPLILNRGQGPRLDPVSTTSTASGTDASEPVYFPLEARVLSLSAYKARVTSCPLHKLPL